jgi:thiamine-monophosphate kinase
MTRRPQDDGPLHGEEAIIQMLAPLAEGAPGAFGLQDDCALLTPEPGCDLVLKTDPVAEGVHFLADDPPEDVAWKALAVNVSDLAAKAARPLGYLMALSFPAPPSEAWLTRFIAGLRQAQNCFGCQLLGGDTDRRPGPRVISISIVGTVEKRRMVRRGTARDCEAIFVSGTVGDAALGLALRKEPALAGRWGLSPDEVEHLRRRYARPQPRLALAAALREHASSAMDLSDGLAKDLGRLCKASGCAARVRLLDLPLSPAAAKALAADPGLAARIVAGGDDYEVLATVPPAGVEGYQSLAAASGIVVTRIGSTLSGAGAVIEGIDGVPLALDRTGWDHFQAPGGH